VFDGSEGGVIDIGSVDVPARRETGFIEDQWSRGLGNDAVLVADGEFTRALANVNAVVAVGGMAEDAFVFFVEGVHGAPGESYARIEFAGVGGQASMLPCGSGGGVLAHADGVPGCGPEIGVLGGVAGGLESMRNDIAFGEVGDWITAGFEEEDDALAIGDPGSAETDAHAAAEGLGVQQAFGE
jgi:hypothetical protein